jgi:hypothetical protein
MKTIRLIAGILLVITGVLHFVVYGKTPNDPGMIGFLVFGIIYGLTGLLLFIQKMYPVYMGLIFPLIGLTLVLIKFGFPTLVSLKTVLNIIDVIVIICCAMFLANREKASETTRQE